MPVIALLTDFGTQDIYVGVMKGVIWGICPEAKIADLTHEIPPQDVTAGALALWGAFRFFPKGTVFCAVVDPALGRIAGQLPFKLKATFSSVPTTVCSGGR